MGSDVSRAAAQVVAVQLAVGVVAFGLIWLTPARLGFAVPLAALSVFFGAWGWAQRVGRDAGLLNRESVRAIAWRAGLAGGFAVAVIYVVVGLVPGQVSIPMPALALVGATIGVGAGLAVCILTLCGLDLARPATRSDVPP